MSGRRYRNFDEMWAEQKLEPITIEVLGTTHVLPARLPARIVLRAERLQAERGEEGNVSAAEIAELAHDFFGQKTVEDWFAKGMAIDQLSDVFKGSMALYSERSEVEVGEPEGEAPAPEGAQPPSSSSTGDSSKPTSSASTG